MANIIKQLQDPQGNNIFPIGFNVGGVKCDLLWTNPNPSSAISSGGTIALPDVSDYTVLIFESKAYSGRSNEVLTSTFTTYGVNHTFEAVGEVNTDMRRHIFKFTSSTQIQSVNGGDPVPIKLYGIKLAYYCPTNAPDLQYEEV